MSTSIEGEMSAARIDLKCEKCDYLLRGLDVAGRCPECGHAIADSASNQKPQRSRSTVRPYLALLGCAVGYALLNFVVLYVMMEADPFVIFNAWPTLAVVLPISASLACIVWWIGHYKCRWIDVAALAGFVVWLLCLGWLNFAFMLMCAAAV